VEVRFLSRALSFFIGFQSRFLRGNALGPAEKYWDCSEEEIAWETKEAGSDLWIFLPIPKVAELFESLGGSP
jgi:hypothetical protein